MGSSKSTTNTQTSNNQTTNQDSSERWNQYAQGSQQTIFDPRSAQEQYILNQYQDLGDEQRAFLQQLMSGASPYTMNQGDQDLVNQSFDAANQRFDLAGKDYADYLATTRGLNKSDTPVSQQAMQRYGLGKADLESQRAQAALNYGLQGSQLRLAGAQSLPAGLGAAFMPMFNERMAGGRTQSSQNQGGSSNANFYNSTFGNSSSNTTQRQTPSLMSQIGQGMQLGAQGALLGGGLMTQNPMMLMGSMGMDGKGLGSLLTSMSPTTQGIGTGINSGSSYNAAGAPLSRYGFTSPL